MNEIEKQIVWLQERADLGGMINNYEYIAHTITKLNAVYLEAKSILDQEDWDAEWLAALRSAIAEAEK